MAARRARRAGAVTRGDLLDLLDALQDKDQNVQASRDHIAERLDKIAETLAVVSSEVSRLSPIVAGLEQRVALGEGARRTLGAIALGLVGAAGGLVGAIVSWILNAHATLPHS